MYSISRDSLDKGLNYCENVLSVVAAIPLIGTVIAATKLMLGVGESVGALTYGIFAKANNLASKNKSQRIIPGPILNTEQETLLQA
jgi:uncharacterized protein (DUF697 family)